MTETKATSPLEGLVVVEAGTMISCAAIGRLFADFGATVIKIEHPERGDPLRDLSPQKNDVGLWWKYLCRNKKTATLDLSAETGQEVFKDLASEADVVVENFRPGTMEQWNLGYEALQEVNPGLVMARVSGFGQDGPYSEKPGFGTLAEAMSGFAHINGFEDSPPLLPKTGFADAIAALYATFAIMFALYHRDVGDGSGQYIDTSLLEPIFAILGPQPLQYDLLGEIETRSGNQSKISAPRNVYRTADGRYVALSASVQSIALRTFDAIDRPELKEDPRFRTNEDRVENADELDDAIQAWMADHSREEALQRFDEHAVPLAPIYNVADIVRDEHFEAREALADVDDGDLGETIVQNVFPKLSETPGQVTHLGPRHRAHNDYVYEEILQYDEEVIGDLEAEGVI